MSSSFVAVRALRTAINNGNVPWRSYANTSKVTKQGKGSSSSTSSSSGVADGKNIDPPQNVFKKVDNSKLGPGASKQSEYKNPEYFSYHNMTFSEMEVVMSSMRVPQPKAK